MAIQNRRGNYADFDPTKMVAGEFAVVQNGDPNGTDGEAIYIAPKAGKAKRLATADEMRNLIYSELEKIIEDLDGLSDEVKDAFLNCFQHVAWIDHDFDYYEELKNVLYPKELTSITATFDQDGNVFSETDVLNDLKPFLTVTANYSDESHANVQNYTLSGTLTSGSATITVGFEDKTTTFTVTVSTVPTGYTAKNYVVADGTQYISTQISETSAVDWWYRIKELRTDYTNRVGHIFSSANMYAPYLFAFGTDENCRLNAKRYGNEIGNYEYTLRSWQINEEYVIEGYKDNNNITINGVIRGSVPAGSTVNPNYTFAILGYRASDGAVAQRFRFVGNLYYLKTVDKNTNKKTHDFVPCTNQSNVVGLYDLVDGVFYPPTEGTLIAR